MSELVIDVDSGSSVGYESDARTAASESPIPTGKLSTTTTTSTISPSSSLVFATTATSNLMASCSRRDPTAVSNQASPTQAPHHSRAFPTALVVPSYRVGNLAAYVQALRASNRLEVGLCSSGEGGTYLIRRTAPASPSFLSAPPHLPSLANGHADDGPQTVSPSSVQPSPAIAVFKPKDEEIGCPANPRGNTTLDRPAFTPGGGYLREELAYRLDHRHFAGVPETVVSTLNGKTGSLQRFIPSSGESWDTTPGRFSVSSVHRIAIFDLRVLNGDRHGGNLLVSAADKTHLVPIDHSYILPDGFADPEFEWMDWPQAKVPLTAGELEYIAELDADADAMLVAETLGDEAADVIAVTTRLLKTAAARGYTLSEIAHYCRRETLTQPSRLEELLAACRSDETLAVDVEAAIAAICAAFPDRRPLEDESEDSVLLA